MWQRKQTIFLILAAVCNALMIFLPVWTAVDGDTKKILTALLYTVKVGDVHTTVYFPYAICSIFAVAAATVAIMEIGKFENRLLQLKLGALNSLLMTGALGSAVYFAMKVMKMNGTAGDYDIGFYLPAAAMIFNLIANRFIRRDEKLVRDSERIR
jgi:Domain of unknown function (DUF4293)